MFKKRRNKADKKQLELCIRLIDEYSTMRAQHEYLFSRIRDLEARVEKLEPKKIDDFVGEGEL